MFASTAVGLPGLAALAFGFFLFLVALLTACWRATKAPAVREAGRINRSWLWIGVQALAIASVAIGPVRVIRDPLSMSALAQGAGVALLMLAAVGLFHASSRALGRNWSLVARTRSEHQLVRSGPFAYVRHPIYVALLLVLLAIALAYGHGPALLLGIPLYAIGTMLRVRDEEQLLRQLFGRGFDDYAARVKRFVPGLF